MKKLLAIGLLITLLLQTFAMTWALKIERPDYDIDIKRRIENSNTNGEASVGLGVFIDDFDNESNEYGADCVSMNVSMTGNSRMGLNYTCETYDELYDWMREDWCDTHYRQEIANVGDDWGMWVDPQWQFCFKFYGGKYRNVYTENASSKIWVSSNGFVSFDLSNSTNPYSYSIPNPTSPNAIIAPLWADLKIDNQSKIIIMESTKPLLTPYLVVIWKNALHKFSEKRLTFAVALESCFDEDPGLEQGEIYIAYQNVTSISSYFTYGIEDHEGRKGTGQCVYGSELEALNGTTLHFYQDCGNFYIDRLTLEFEDQNYNQSRYNIMSENDDFIRGNNLRTKTGSQSDYSKGFGKALIGTGTFLLGMAGYLLDTSMFPMIAPIKLILLIDTWADLMAKAQYNGTDWLELKDDDTDPEIQRAYITVPADPNVIVDASLCTVFHWILDSQYTENHNLTISATLTYHDYFYGPDEKNVTTSVNIEIGPDNNNSFDTADEIQEGTHGVDPMLWLGGYDSDDYYQIFLGSGFVISVTAYPYSIQDFTLYLYDPDPNEVQKAKSEHQGPVTESIEYTADSTGWWRIRLKIVTGIGLYNMSISIELPGGCPFVYVWDGQQYILDNNLMPTSLKYNGTDVEDYYKLEQTLMPKHQGRLFSWYSLQIREFENEHSYIDQVKLLAVDHNPDFNIAVTPNGEIVNYWQPLPPMSSIDNNGRNRLNEILFMDGNTSDPATYFNGEINDYLILNFGQINAENAKLILRSDKKCAYPPYCCIEIQVLNNNEWQTVATIAPRAYWATEAVNLTPYVVADQDLIVRLYWTLPHRLDYVGLDTMPPDQTTTIFMSPTPHATHSAHGDVTAKLLFNDQIYAELTPNEQINLTFALPNNPTQTRTFILYTNGHYHTITT